MKCCGTSKFLNQVSNYSYSLAQKNIENEPLTDEELDNLYLLHEYCVELEQSLNQLSEEIYSGKITWKDLDKNEDLEYAQAVDNISVLSSIKANLEEYEGLIYDGAYSDHINKAEKVGLTGDEIDEEKAYEKVQEFFGEEKIEKIVYNNALNDADIECYDFSVILKENKENTINIEITKIGGHVLEMQNNREVLEEKISQEDADNFGKEFLKKIGYDSMESTYYIKLSNIVTINYAYLNNDILVYPDLIKVKIALDNGEILGIETEGYLNSHQNRLFEDVAFEIEDVRENINSKLNIVSEKMVVIPTEWKTELLCYEFKGEIEGKNFLVYINAQTGKEEEILIILDTPGGKLTI